MDDFYLIFMLFGNMYSSYFNFWLWFEILVFVGYFEYFRFGWVFIRENVCLVEESKLKLLNIINNVEDEMNSKY